MVAVTGAIEITVHGWDISVACGARRPVPPGLAAVLLPIAPAGDHSGHPAWAVRRPGAGCPAQPAPAASLSPFLGCYLRLRAAPGPATA